MNKNHKQLHLELTRKLKDLTLPDYELEAVRQRLHYIETEYAYRPRYSELELRPRCKDSKTHTHKRNTQRKPKPKP